MVQDDPKLLDDGGEIPKSQRRGWRFDTQLWISSLLNKITCQVINCLLCFGIDVSAYWLKKEEEKDKKKNKSITHEAYACSVKVPGVVKQKSVSPVLYTIRPSRFPTPWVSL